MRLRQNPPRIGLMLAAAISAGGALAVEPDERLADAALEARARAISTGLRCLICQNQSIDDSNAPLARDLRILVRERLAAGSTDADVERFLVQRYGEFVLLQPKFGLHTLILWLTPLLLLAAVSATLLRRAQSHSPQNASADPSRPLSSDEQQRLDQILRADTDLK